MIIREAHNEDSPALAQIQVASYQSAYRGILPDDYLERFDLEEQTQDWKGLIGNMQAEQENLGPGALSQAAKPVPFLLVAENESGELLGYALGHAGGTDLSGYSSELDALHIVQNRQRQGIGRLLIHAMAGYLYSSGADSMLVWVLKQNPARSLYERMGGELLGHRDVTLGSGSVVAEEIAYGWREIRDLIDLE